MAQIVPRERKGGGKSYRVRWRYAGARDGDWQGITFRDLDTAKAFKGAVEARGHRVRDDAPEVRDLSIITGGRPLRSAAPTFGEVAQRYIDTRTTSKKNTRDTYSRYLRTHLADWRNRGIDQITADDVAEMVNTFTSQDRSPVVVFDFTRSVFRYATNTEPPLRTGNPCSLVKVPRKRKRTLAFLTQEEADLLVDSAPEQHRPMIETALNTGLRVGELMGLRVRDLHLGIRATLTVSEQIRRAQGGEPSEPGDPKSEASKRTIALDEHTAKLLRTVIKDLDAEDHVFRNPRTGKHWTYSRWQETVWAPIRDQAIASGLGKRPRPHDLRHTHASWLLTDGVPLLVVSRRLGHESVAVTANIYGHIQPEADDMVRAVMGERTRAA